MANFTPNYFTNTQLPFSEELHAESKRVAPKKSTIDFILSYSKSLEFVKNNNGSKAIVAEVNLN